MRILSILALCLFFVSCGSERTRNPRAPGPIPKDKFITLAKAEVTITNAPGLFLASTINYTVPLANAFGLDVSGVAPAEVGDTIVIGNIDISDLRINDLYVCGSGTDKCTTAVVRVYTTELSGYEGISGFVNTDDNYSIDVTVSESGGLSGTVGLDVAGSVTVDSYTIPSNDRKLTIADFSGVSYDFVAGDIDNNAGVGSYEMSVTIEIAVN